MKNQYRLFHVLLFLCGFSQVISAQGTDYVEIRKLEGNRIVYEKYKYDGQYFIDITDLTIWDEVLGRTGDPFNTFYAYSENLRILLLQKGYAKLNDSHKANPQEVEAQAQARSAGRGIWKQAATTDTKVTGTPKPEEVNWREILTFLWKTVLVLGSIGIIGAVGKKLHRSFYIQRRIKLLMIGEPSSGKTALLITLADPHARASELLNIPKSQGIAQKKGLKHIPRGKFEIIPEITDIPGSAFASVWDKLIGSYSHALLVVLCPHRTNGVAQDGSRQLLDLQTGIDQKYIDMQIGYTQAYVEGGLGAKQTRKPKIVILFISKFDLFSTTPPDDSASREVIQKLRNVFKDHINSAETAAKKANIPFELVFGSAVERWNTEQILGAVARTLYSL